MMDDTYTIFKLYSLFFFFFLFFIILYYGILGVYCFGISVFKLLIKLFNFFQIKKKKKHKKMSGRRSSDGQLVHSIYDPNSVSSTQRIWWATAKQINNVDRPVELLRNNKKGIMIDYNWSLLKDKDMVKENKKLRQSGDAFVCGVAGLELALKKIMAAKGKIFGDKIYFYLSEIALADKNGKEYKRWQLKKCLEIVLFCLDNIGACSQLCKVGKPKSGHKGIRIEWKRESTFIWNKKLWKNMWFADKKLIKKFCDGAWYNNKLDEEADNIESLKLKWKCMLYFCYLFI